VRQLGVDPSLDLLGDFTRGDVSEELAERASPARGRWTVRCGWRADVVADRPSTASVLSW
jgi:hypothetical protein